MNDQSDPRNPGFQVMHWREDLQFIYVFDAERLQKEKAMFFRYRKTCFMPFQNTKTE